jgi:DNA-binding CsgD family transcriptional regulator
MEEAQRTNTLEEARAAYARRDLPAARDAFLVARAEGSLTADDADALGDAAWWIGDVETSLSAYEEAYRHFLQGDRPRNAAMSALGVAISLYLRGDETIGSGWMSRAQRLLRDEPEGLEHGYLRYISAEATLRGDDPDATIAAAQELQDFARRYQDPTLAAAATMLEGRALIRRGDVAAGMGMLDEAMLAVLSDELAPDWTGNIYCHLVEACVELAEHRRAGEWTEALAAWCERMEPAVVFTGVCRVHRAQLLQLRGAWERAEAEAVRVCEELDGIHRVTVAEGAYALGDIRRLRGDLDGAREAYARAHHGGRDPEPGLALLSLAEGRPAAARASIRAALAATNDRLARAALLPAAVEIALAADRPDEAREASKELDGIAAAFDTSGLRACAAHARGLAVLVEGDAGAALSALRGAVTAWQDLEAPYEVARVRVAIAIADRELGDEDATELELRAAEEVFERLGAALDLDGIRSLRGRPALPDGLTSREAEVLGLVASGKSNREVAADLFISEKTVARHLSNIFAKVGVSSRTEAAAYAFEHGLAARRG